MILTIKQREINPNEDSIPALEIGINIAKTIKKKNAHLSMTLIILSFDILRKFIPLLSL